MKKELVILNLVFLVSSVTFAGDELIKINLDLLEPGILVKIPANPGRVFVLVKKLETPLTKEKIRKYSRDLTVIRGYIPNSGCELVYAGSDADDWGGHPVDKIGGFVDKCSNSEYNLDGIKLVGPATSPDRLLIPDFNLINKELIIYK